MNKLRLGAVALCLSFFMSCEESDQQVKPEKEEISSEILAKIETLGFSTVDAFQYDGKYFVENDIVLTDAHLESLSEGKIYAFEEQYSTDNLVTALPRTIKVYLSSSFSSKYFTALDAALGRYNAEGLSITFQRVTSASSANMVINPSPWYYYWFGILGSGGFPTAAGNPHGEILLTKQYYDGINNPGALTTTLAHEIGHCIGFRHTDYMDRSFSCGGSTDNEGDGGVGANYIPGTSASPESGSWMLACSDGSDRPFTSNDKTALDYLY
ncbi:M57 family metalloprotease [Fulvivirga ligni]|uniref:M57 family metalloprotease n=1 Tax=Fulvivirga ligni TaxID=2904246 RepID=UPI001F25A777|nr:M57 family metalloprotease [Fulvivirga ligni]UII19503.1 zinc-dependent metalloprotease [Fulvivirga ligni]